MIVLRGVFLVFGLCLVLAFANPGLAVNYDATNSGDWNDNATWGGSGFPNGAGDNAEISAGTSITVTLVANASANDTTIGENDSLSFAGGNLYLNGTMTLGLNFGAGNLIRSVGSFDVNNLVVRDGSSAAIATGDSVRQDATIGGGGNDASGLVLGSGTFNVGTGNSGALYMGGNGNSAFLTRSGGLLDVANLTVRDGSDVTLVTGDQIRNNLSQDPNANVSSTTVAGNVSVGNDVTFGNFINLNAGKLTVGGVANGTLTAGLGFTPGVLSRIGGVFDTYNLQIRDGSDLDSRGGDVVRNNISINGGSDRLSVTTTPAAGPLFGLTLDGTGNSIGGSGVLELNFTDPAINYSGLYWAFRWKEDGSDPTNGHSDELTALINANRLVIDTSALTGSYTVLTNIRPGDGYTYVGFQAVGVPEPTGFALAVIGLLSIARRRRS